MKFRTTLLLIALCALPACDVQEENPLSSPSEYFEQGVAYFHDGLYRQAEDSFGRALGLMNQTAIHINVAELYGYLGRANFELGEYRAALENLERASQKSSQMYDYRLQAQTNQWEGDVYLELRDYDNAVESYRRSIRLSSALNDLRVRALTELQASAALISAARFDQASSLINEAQAAFQASGNSQDMALVLQQVGELYYHQGRYSEALNTFDQAFESAGGDTPLLQAKLKLNIGDVCRLQRNANDAITAFRDAVNILRRRHVNKEYEALALFRLGAVYEENGRLADARKFYSDALETDRSLGDRIAEDYLYLFVLRCNLGLMSPDQRSRSTEELLKSYRQIAAKFADCGHRTGEAYTDVLMGTVEESRNNLAEARILYQRAVDLDLGITGEYYSTDLHLPILRELGISDNRAAWYDKLSSVLLKLGLKNDAMAVLDLLQVKASVEKLRHLNISVKHPRLKDLVKETRSKSEAIEILEFELSSMLSGKTKFTDNQRVSGIQSQLSLLQKDVREKTDHIVSVQPNYEVLLPPVMKKSHDLQSLVPEGTVVLQYLPAEDGLSILALSRERLDVGYVAIGKDSLLSQVREYLQLLQDPSVYAGVGGEASIGVMTRFEKLSTQLYDLLIRPVDSRFQRNLVIVARDEFRGFPFQSLERQDARGNVKYLIELTSVDYLSSLSSLSYKTVGTTGIRTIFALGNPSGKNWSVDYELHDVRSFYKNATIMLGVDASFKNIGSRKPDLLQLSLDFVNASGESDLGSFVCSTGKTIGETESIEYERLTENDPPPVVELSNQSTQGSGLTSLHALLLRMNGTSDVFLNAWTADRKSAKFFSESFYTNLAAGLAPGDAYRQALLNLISMRELSHPRSWGQFFHFGIG